MWVIFALVSSPTVYIALDCSNGPYKKRADEQNGDCFNKVAKWRPHSIHTEDNTAGFLDNYEE